MTIFGTSDLPAMLADFGVPIAWGAVTGKALVDRPDQDLLAQAAVSFTGREIVATLETDRFMGLAKGATLYVEGQSHQVLATRQIGDGALTEVYLLPIPGPALAPVRVFKGKNPSWNDLGDPDLGIAGVTLAAGSTLGVLVATRGGIGPDRGPATILWGAAPLTKVKESWFGTRGTLQYWVRTNVVGGTAAIAADIPHANAKSGAMIAHEIQNAASSSVGESWAAAGTGEEPTVEADGPISHPNSILIAAAAMEPVLPDGDPGSHGGWTHGFTAGEFESSLGGGDEDCNLHEAYRVVAAAGTYAASNPGRTAAAWAALLVEIKGA